MRQRSTAGLWVMVAALWVAGSLGGVAYAQDAAPKGSSYAPVDIKEDFAATMARMQKDKPAVMKRQWICSTSAMI